CLNTGEVTVHGLSRRKSRSFQFSNLLTSFDHMNEFEVSSWLARIDELVAKRRIDVVMPVTNLAIRTLSEHRRSLKCSERLALLPEPHIFDTATNKASLAGILATHGLHHPPTVVVTADAPRPKGLSTLTFPVLAKPPLEGTCDTIRRFETPKELDAFLTGQGKGRDWVVQEFIQGRDLGVNVLCQDGKILASTVQYAIVPSPIPYLPATGFEFR